MTGETVYARGGDNILEDGVVTGTAPLTSYSLATLITRQPAARVRYGATTVTVVVTLSTPALGDIVAIPVSNADAGSGVLVVSNGSGLSVAITIPAVQANGIPNTAIKDLKTAVPNAATRTSNVWTFTFTGNSVNLILGGGLAIFGPKRTLDPDMGWGYEYRERHASSNTANEYLTRYTVNYQTTERSVIASIRTDDLAGVLAWFQANAGGAAPGLLWPQIAGFDAYYGTWDTDFAAKNVAEGTEFYDVALTFREFSKGLPV